MEKEIINKNKELAIQHWKYIEGLLDVSLLAEETYDMDTVIAMCRFHYITAWEHGAKHYAELLKEYNQSQNKNKKSKMILSQDETDQLIADEILAC